jgi:hypothetical protein
MIIEAVNASETSVNVYQTTRQHPRRHPSLRGINTCHMTSPKNYKPTYFGYFEPPSVDHTILSKLLKVTIQIIHLEAVGFELLTAASMKMAVFWVVTLCELLPDYTRLCNPEDSHLHLEAILN